MNDIKILGPNGQPLPPMRSKASMLVGGSRVPYDAADSFSDQLANWQPALWSPDNEINIYRDRIVSRVRDLARNDGWASGSITRVLDNAVGANFRPILKPDYRMLALMTGNTAFDATGQMNMARWLRLTGGHGLMIRDVIAMLSANKPCLKCCARVFGTSCLMVMRWRCCNTGQIDWGVGAAAMPQRCKSSIRIG